jgi:hypothetical protein
MRRSLILVLAMLVMGLLAASCFDSSTPSGSTQSSGGPTGDASQAVPHWQIRYEIGRPAVARRWLPACPSGARCRAIRPKGWGTSSGKPLWARMITRTLICPSGGGGDYLRGQSACRALRTLRAVLGRKTAGACPCPLSLDVPGEATLIGGSHRITLPLTFCPYCGHGNTAGVDHALALLQSRG